MKEQMKVAGKRLARIIMSLIALGLFAMAGLAIASAFASIAFGGLFRRLAGYETIMGSVIAIGIGVSLLKARPKTSSASQCDNRAEQCADDQLPARAESEVE